MASHAPPSRWSRLLAWVSGDVVGGALMIGAAVVGLCCGRTPRGRRATRAVRDRRRARRPCTSISASPRGPPTACSRSSSSSSGVELKHEIVAGSLRNPRAGRRPRARGGRRHGRACADLRRHRARLATRAALHGWAIPTATDIAFALAVLAIFGRGLPVAMRIFLLTLAVVDDLLAIVIIAVFYTEDVNSWSLLGVVSRSSRCSRSRVRAKTPRWWILLPLAVVAWALMHDSGVHATIAGVLLGFSVPAIADPRRERVPRTQQLEHTRAPVSPGIALPVFAFFAAGVSLVGGDGPRDVLTDPVAIAIVVALVLGKLIGVLGVTALVTRLTAVAPAAGIGVRDLLPVGLPHRHRVHGVAPHRGAVLRRRRARPTAPSSRSSCASVIAAVLAGFTLRWDADAPAPPT